MKRCLLLLAIFALAGALAQVAAAAPSSPASGPASGSHHPVEAEAEEDEGEAGESELADEFEVEECEGEDFGLEFEEAEEEPTEGEEEELEAECEDKAKGKGGKDAPFVTAPAACHVSRAESKIKTLPATDQVRLTVRYRTWVPTPVTVDLKLRDRKGAVGIEQATAHLGARGVLHITTKLGDSVMERALKASEFDVSMLAPGTPGYCVGALEQQLRSVKHTGADAPRVYSD